MIPKLALVGCVLALASAITTPNATVVTMAAFPLSAIAPTSDIRDASLPRRSPAATRSRVRITPAAISWVESVRACIIYRESRGNYRARRTDGGTASGAYQFIDTTWRAVTGRRDSAWQAPKAVQDKAFYTLFANGRGRSAWSYPSKECW